MEKPNILIFMTDQQRGDTVLSGSPAVTPHIDKFSNEGITFSRSYCPSPHCCPSRASFFTGLYPHEHGVWNNVNVENALSRGLKEGVRTWSEDFIDAGYDLYWSGKWHISDVESPSDRGWNEHFVLGGPTFCDKRDNSPQWENYRKKSEVTEPEFRNPGQILRSGYGPYTHYGVDENPNPDQKIVDSALEALERASSSDSPWVVFTGTVGPHDPYFVPQRFLDLYDPEEIELPPSFLDTMGDKPGLYRRTRERFDQLSDEEHRESIRHYLALCSYEDYLFSQLLEKLEETGQVGNTLVVYLSDHGDYMAEHGLWCKGLPSFNGAYHIPAIVRWPARIENPCRDITEFVSISDFAPTFLEAAGIVTGRKFTGRSLIPFIDGKTPECWRDAVFTVTNGNELYGIQRSVKTSKWKYVYNGFDYDELYDLQNDPEEMVNLSGQERYKPIVRDMCRRMWRFGLETRETSINPYVPVALAPYGPAEAFA